MAALKKENSQMADGDGNPLIGVAQDAIADVVAAGVDSANLIAAVNAIIAALEAHGLIKDS
jgi:hypothetical protein